MLCCLCDSEQKLHGCSLLLLLSGVLKQKYGYHKNHELQCELSFNFFLGDIVIFSVVLCQPK
jgi:hypothetical protein